MRLKLLIPTLFVSLFFNLSWSQSITTKADKEYELHAYPLAIESYNKVIDKGVANSLTYARLADCYRHMNQMEEAAKWYKKAIDAKDVPPEHILNYGKVLMALGDYQLAKEWFNAYAVSVPAMGNHYIDMANIALERSKAPAEFEVIPLPYNTEAADFGAVKFRDQLVFASARTDFKFKNKDKGDDWTGENPNRLYKVSLQSEKADQKVEAYHAKLRNTYNEGPLTYSADGKKVYFTKNNFISGIRQHPSAGFQFSIFAADLDESGDWAISQPFEHNASGFNTGYPNISPDGNALFFASDRPEGYGGMDIYVCYKYGDTWTAPENLGPQVNSRGNEIAPFFDGNHLYFSSDFHPGLGGFDVFKAVKTSSAWDKIYHMGTAINSSRDDFGFAFYPEDNLGFLTSNRKGGKGNEDLYRLHRLEQDLTILIKDAAKGNPIQGATVDFTYCEGGGMASTDEEGKIVREAIITRECKVVISKEGYRLNTLKLSPDKPGQNYEVNLVQQGEVYYGRVIDQSSGNGIPDVVIKLKRASDANEATAFTDVSGKFFLALAADETYEITYSKKGYIESTQTILTKEEKDENILGTIRLQSVLTALENPAEEEQMDPLPGKEGETPDAIANTKETPSDNTDAPSEFVARGDSGPGPKVNKKAATITGNGFAVQVASVKSSPSKNLGSFFDKLSDVGNVYVTQVDNLNKIRVGVYATQSEAEIALQSILSKGFEGAFVLEDRGPLYSEVPESSNVIATAEAVEGEIKIRLASYTNPKWFEPNKLEGLGEVEKEVSGKFTIFYLKGIDSLEEGKNKLVSVKEKGFVDAYLVNIVNGEVKKVQ
jgi:tetratricopeptide (TPR) repeat protein/cell division septation protein DedD